MQTKDERIEDRHKRREEEDNDVFYWRANENISR